MGFEIDFANIVDQMIQDFNESSVDIDRIIAFINQVPSTSQHKLPRLLTDHNEINIWGLFRLLSGLELWDFRNYYLLKTLTDKFLNKTHSDITKRFDKHDSKLEEFENKTSLCLYIVARNFTGYEPSKYYELLEIKLDRPCRNYSIREQEYVRENLFEKRLKLYPWQTILNGETEGCIHQWWTIPASLTPYLKKEVPKLRDFCMEYGITAIKLKDFTLLENTRERCELNSLHYAIMVFN